MDWVVELFPGEEEGGRVAAGKVAGEEEDGGDQLEKTFSSILNFILGILCEHAETYSSEKREW